MLLSKVTIDRHLQNHIGRKRGYCGRCPTRTVPYYTYPYTPLWPAIRINPHNFRPIVGTIIAVSIGRCPRYSKKRNGTQTALQNTAGLSLTLNLQSQQSPPCCEDIRLQLLHSQQRQTTPDTGMPPPTIFICSPTLHPGAVAARLGSKQRPRAARAEAARVGRWWPCLDSNGVTPFVLQYNRGTLAANCCLQINT